MLGLQRVNTSG